MMSNGETNTNNIVGTEKERVVTVADGARPGPSAKEVERLIERSLLGTPGARAMREQFTREDAEDVIARVRARREGRSSSDAADVADASSAAEPAAPVAHATLSAADGVTATPHPAPAAVAGDGAVASDLKDRIRRRHEILAVLAVFIEDAVGIPAGQVAWDTRLPNDIFADPLVVAEVAAHVGGAYLIELDPAILALMPTASEAVDYIEREAYPTAWWELSDENVPVGWVDSAQLMDYLHGETAVCSVADFNDANISMSVGTEDWRFEIKFITNPADDVWPPASGRGPYWHYPEFRNEHERTRLWNFGRKVLDVLAQHQTNDVHKLTELLDGLSASAVRRACAILIEQTRRIPGMYCYLTLDSASEATPPSGAPQRRWRAAPAAAGYDLSDRPVTY